MSLEKHYRIEKHHGMYLGWTTKYKGIAAQGNTRKSVISELDLLIKIKLDYDRCH